jgi:CTP synthase
MLHQNGFDRVVCRELGLQTPDPDLRAWEEMLARIAARDKAVTIALVGKYVRLHDAYLSVSEALSHAGYECGARVDIRWVDSEDITDENVSEILGGCDGS